METSSSFNSSQISKRLSTISEGKRKQTNKQTNKQTEKKTTTTKDKHNAELQQKPPREDAHGVTMTLKHA